MSSQRSPGQVHSPPLRPLPISPLVRSLTARLAARWRMLCQRTSGRRCENARGFNRERRRRLHQLFVLRRHTGGLNRCTLLCSVRNSLRGLKFNGSSTLSAIDLPPHLPPIDHFSASSGSCSIVFAGAATTRSCGPPVSDKSITYPALISILTDTWASAAGLMPAIPSMCFDASSDT